MLKIVVTAVCHSVRSPGKVLQYTTRAGTFGSANELPAQQGYRSPF